MTRLVLALAALLPLLAGHAALAQEEPPAPAPAPRVRVAPEAGGAPAVLPSARSTALPMRISAKVVSEPVRVAVNKTMPVELPAAVRDIVVGNPDVADVIVRSPTEVYVSGRQAGQTNVVFLDRSGRPLRRLDVDVHVDSDALRDVLRQVMPDERNIQVSAVGEAIFLAGTVRSEAAAASARTLARRYVKDDASVVTMMRVATEQQVLMQVKVAEMQKTVLKELGVGVSSGRESLHLDDVSALVSTTGTIGLTTSASSLFGSVTVAGVDSLVATFSALERQGLIKTLVEPNLTAVSGETASLLAGGEFPIPVSEQDNTVTLEFKPFGVSLNFVPVVLDPGRISLKLQTEVSAVDNNTAPVVLNNFRIPGLTVRRASSTVEMPSGGSIMIAGLLQNDITSTLSGMPGIMDVPVLGALFRSNSFQRKETELVVIVSAYVVQPMDKPGLALPTDGFTPSSDLDLYVMGKLQETYTRPAATSPVPAQLQGPMGYIVQ